jgi:hypothetical protein
MQVLWDNGNDLFCDKKIAILFYKKGSNDRVSAKFGKFSKKITTFQQNYKITRKIVEKLAH